VRVPAEIDTGPPENRKAPLNATRTGQEQGALRTATTCHFVARPKASGKCFRFAFIADLVQELGECLAASLTPADQFSQRRVFLGALHAMIVAKRRSCRRRQRQHKQQGAAV
jgi:hypothetical protein